MDVPLVPPEARSAAVEVFSWRKGCFNVYCLPASTVVVLLLRRGGWVGGPDADVDGRR